MGMGLMIESPEETSPLGFLTFEAFHYIYCAALLQQRSVFL